ncbi:hypothetical protein D9613_006770 [Agrocybe pediades]|uniref:Protein mms22 n=1 Tax=Agrocybe pediades TaxID=84607 RepID=A0A8H4VK71_9AGAR|nr:hypothetical protein D9613_006770 [Agrocybe pediades]
MIDLDEVIETSDAEEQAEIAAQKAILPRVRHVSELGTEHYLESPRKKIKVQSDHHDENHVHLQPPFVGLSPRTPRKAPLLSTSSPAQTLGSLSAPLTPEKAAVAVIVNPEEEGEASTLSDHVAEEELEYSQDPLLLCSPPHSPSVSVSNSEYEPLSFPVTPSPSPKIEDAQPIPSPSSQSEPLFFPTSPLQSPVGEDVSSTTPQNSPPANLRRSPIFDLGLFDIPLLSQAPPTLQPAMLKDSPMMLTRQEDDELLLFTPEKHNPEPQFTSPLTPASVHSPILQETALKSRSPSHQPSDSPSPLRSPSRSSNKSISKAPTNSPPAANSRTIQQDAQLAMNLAAENEQAEGSRYSFRARKMHQKMPFTADQLMYQRQLRANPEAIVNTKEVAHIVRQQKNRSHPDDRYEEEEGTQQDEEDPEWERQERRRLREERRKAEAARRSETRTTEGEPVFRSALLEDLSSTDEDERKELNAVVREAKRIAKRLERQKKAEERAERERKKKEKEQEEEERRRLKRFPISTRSSVPPDTSRSKATSNRGASEHSDESDAGLPTSRSKGKARAIEVDSDEGDVPAPILDEDQAIYDYFGGDGGFQAYDDDFPMQEIDNHSVHERTPSPTRSPILQNTYDTAIHVDSDDEDDARAGPSSSTGEGRSKSVRSSSAILVDLPARHKQALSKMWPALMINKVAQAEAAKLANANKRKERDAKKDNATNGPLLPGQTRVQVSAKPKEVKEIKGDSESEVEIESDSNDSTHSSANVSDEDEILKLHNDTGHRPLQKRKIIKLAELDLSDPVVSHPEKKRHKRRIHDPLPIQYMLTRGKRVERDDRGSNVGHAPARSKKPSTFKLDVVTRDARGKGAGKQTMLSFNTSKDPASKSSGAKHRASRSVTPQNDYNHFDDDKEVQIVKVEHQDPKVRAKEAKKQRRRAKKKNGVYTISAKDRIITSGRSRETAFITLQLEVEDQFYKAFVPPKMDTQWEKRIKRLKSAPAPKRAHYPSQEPGLEPDEDERPTTHGLQVPSDFRISVLSVGRSFGPATYIRNGWLFEAVNASNPQEVPAPSPVEMFGFELHVEQDIANFSSMLSNVCESLLEFVTSLPDPEADRMHAPWSTFLHAVCQFLTWHMKHGEDGLVRELHQAAKQEILKLLEHIQELGLKHIEPPVLITCRFLMDMSTRLQAFNKDTNDDEAVDPLIASADLTIWALLKVGFDGIVNDLIEDLDLDGSTTSRYAAELWVCTIHILDRVAKPEAEKGAMNHPFWDLLQDNLRKSIMDRPSKPDAMFLMTEDIWLTIFIVCTLSRFSVHGMAVSQSHLPPCWDIVVFALENVRLNAPLLGSRETEADRKRDKYIALLIVRCFQLHNTWKWSLGTAFKMLYKLAGVFKSRSFANLLHEGTEYPEFFRQTDWGLLASYEEDDSAYAVFLKLVYRAFNDPACASWLKKLESIAVPIGSLPFTKSAPPSDADLAKLYNRFAAAALLSDLNRSVCADKVAKARNYVSFSTADKDSRHAIICGVQNWACLLIERGMPVSVIGDWIEEMAETLSSEQKELALLPEGRELMKRTETVHTDIKFLLGAVSIVYDAYQKHALYPEPFLLLRLKPVLSTLQELAPLHQKDAVTGPSARKDVRSTRLSDVLSDFSLRLFMARKAALPSPKRPAMPGPIVEEDSQESQDYGDFGLDDIDWSDIANLPGALQPGGDEGNLDKLEKELREVLLTTNFRQLVYDYLKPYLLMDGQKHRSSNTDLWLYIVLACAHVDNRQDMWSEDLKKLDEILKPIQDEQWVHRVELSIVYQILQLHPMSYLDATIRRRALASLLFAVISEQNFHKKDVRLERQYVELILSLDGLQHPLFAGLNCLPARDGTEDYKFSPEQFLELRVPMLKTIFKNTNDIMARERQGRQDLRAQKTEYVEACRRMFSSMRNTLSHTIKDKASERYQQYVDFCHQVLAATEGCNELPNSTLRYFFEAWPRYLPGPSLVKASKAD